MSPAANAESGAVAGAVEQRGDRVLTGRVVSDGMDSWAARSFATSVHVLPPLLDICHW